MSISSEGISLEDEFDEEGPDETVSLPDESAPVISVPSAEVERRVTRDQFALGDESLLPEFLRAGYSTPESEALLRKRVAHDEDLKNHETRLTIIRDVVEEAKAQGREISPDERDAVFELSADQLADPEIVLEQKFAKKYVEALINLDAQQHEEDSEVIAGVDENPTSADAIMDVAEDISTKQEILHRLGAEYMERFEGTGLMKKGYEFLGLMIPTRSFWTKLRAPMDGQESGAFNFGDDIENTIVSMNVLPPAEYKVEVRKLLEKVFNDNVWEGIQLLSYLQRYTATDRMWDNTATAFDLLDVASIGALTGLKVATKAQKGVKALADRSRQLVTLNSQKGATVSDALVVATDVGGAAKARVVEAFDDALTGSRADPGSGEALAGTLTRLHPGLNNPMGVFDDVGALANTEARRIMDTLGGVRKNLVGAFFDTVANPRVTTAAAKKQMMQEALESHKRLYSHLEDRVLDVTARRHSDEAYGGTDTLVIQIGTKEARPYRTKKEAMRRAVDDMGLKPGEFQAVRYKDTDNWVLEMYQTMDETSLETRIARIETTNAPVDSFVNRWIGAARNPGHTLSQDQMSSRVTATFGGEQVRKRMTEAVKPLAKLKKKQITRLETMLDDNRTMKEVTTPANPMTGQPAIEHEGSWYYTLGDYQKAYYKRFGESPSLDEQTAYFTYKEFHDHDWMNKNLRLVRDKNRRGVSEYQVAWPQLTPNSDPKVATKRKRPGGPGVDLGGGSEVNLGYVDLESSWFEGKEVPALPNYDRTFTVAYPKGDGKPNRYVLSDKFTKDDRDSIEALMKKGYKVIKVENPRGAEIGKLAGSKGDIIEYMIVRSARRRPIQPVQVERRGGPHSMYNEDGMFIKQANSRLTGTGRRVLGPDTTWRGGFGSTAEAHKFTKAIEGARKLLQADWDNPALDAYVRANLPYDSAKKFKEIFVKPGATKTDDLFDVDVPFVTTRTGERIKDIVPSDTFSNYWPGQQVVDVLDSAEDLVGATARGGTQHREDALWGIADVGSPNNPVYKTRQVPRLDPIKTLDRSASEMANSRFMDDHKHQVIEDWVTEFGHLLDMPTDKILADPLSALKNPRWKPENTGRGIGTEVARAKDAKRNILYFINQDNDQSTVFKNSRDAILSSAFKRWGADSAKTKFLETHLWTENSSPIAMMRGYVFSAKLGAWNPRQIFMQAQGTLIVAGIDGSLTRAIQANLGSFLMQGMHLGPASRNAGFVAKASKAAKTLGISDADFREMYKFADESGILNVGREVATLDQMNTGLFKGKFTAIRESSHAPFNFGERHVRATSFNTAYLRWKKENPGAKLTNEVKREILARAHLLGQSMTRAANNPRLQTGLPGMMTQFWTFQTRMVEMLISGQLTTAEKVRLTTLMGTMYGVPAGVGGMWLGAFGFDQVDVQRKWALENGVDFDDPWAQAYFKGIGGIFTDFLAGEQMDFAGSFGPTGMPWMRELLDGNFGVLLGASGSVVGSLVKNFEPLAWKVATAFDGDPNTEWPIGDEALTVLREVSTLNNLARGLIAYNTGELLTKGDIKITDISKKAALWTMVTGMVPQDASDVWLLDRSNDEIRDAKLAIAQKAGVYFRRAFQAAKDGNMKEWKEQMGKGSFVLKTSRLDPIELAKFQASFMKENRSMVEQVQWDFVKNFPGHKEAMERWMDTFSKEIKGNE